MSELPTFDQVIVLLQGVLSGDNAKIQESSKILKKYSKLPDSVGPLVQIIQQNQNAGLRQLASILLRKNILTVFQQLNETAQNELKNILLQRFMEEPLSVVKKQIGYTIGQIAQLTLKQGQWNELYQVLQQQTNANMEEEKRKNGIKLLGTILDFSGEALKDFFGSFYEFFSASIIDPSKEIRVETVKCLVVLFDNVGYMTKQQIEKYKELIPHLLNLIEQLVQEQDEDNIHLILDGFSYLAESKASILDSHFKTIVEYACSQSLLLNPKMPFIIKETCCDLIYTIAEKHRGVFNKNVELIKKTIETSCMLLSTPQKQQDLDDTNSGDNIHDTVLWLVLMLTVHLNKKKIFSILLQAITNLLNSNQPQQQATAFNLLAQMSEGTVDLLIRNLSNPIMNDFIPRGLSSTHPEVKGACIKAIGFFAEWLGGSIIEYHQVILPEIIKSFGDLNQKVQERAMIALDVFCDTMDEDQIALYLAELIPKMVQVPYLQNISVTTKRASISCIASCISTAGQNFRAHIPNVYKLIHELIMMKQTPENDVLTAEAINALAKIANHFSKEDQEVHNTVVVPCMEKIYDLLCNYGSYEINEGCFSFFYNLAEAQGAQFEQLFDKIIEIALKSAASNEGIEFQKDQQNDFSLGSDSEEDENADATQAKVKQGFLDEKAAAIHAIGEFAVACPMKFQNYFEKALGMLDTVFDHFHSNVRQQAMVCYRDLCYGMVKCSNGGEFPQFQKGVPVEKRFDPKIEEIICVDIWTKFLHTIRNDTEPEIVAYNIECITSLIKKLGPAYIAHNIEDLYGLILDVLENRIQCSHVDSEDEEEDEDDTDGMVFEAITDLVPAIAGALKAGFDNGFQQLFPSLMAYTGADRDFNNRIQIVGCFAQIFKKCDPKIIQLALNDLLPRLLNFVVENDDELSRNTTYALGLIVQNGKQFLTQENIQHIMIALKHVFENSEDLACKDNTAASLCRIIMTVPDVVPIDTAMDQILGMAPFTGDEEEEKVVLQTLMFLSETKGEYLQKNIEKVIALFIDGLAKSKPYKIKPALKAKFALFVQNLANQYKDLVEQTVLKLGEAERNTVINLLKQ